MKVGFNYPFSYNRFGSEIGPDIWVDNAEWGRRNALESAGKAASIPLPPLFDHIDRNLANLKGMGITVVRWFLLGHGNNYGPSPIPFPRSVRLPHHGSATVRDYHFAPPARLDLRFRRDFAELLARFQKAELQIIPSLISCEFTSAPRFTPGPRANTGAAGRADILRDNGKRTTFLDTMLAELLAASGPYKAQIYAWEVVNEPIWMYLEFGGGSLPHNVHRVREVSEANVRDFLTEAVKRIDAAKFPSTVGHRYFDDLRAMATGTVPQFHYYADNATWRRVIAAMSPYGVDPPQIRGEKLFAGQPKPFLGEFGSDLNVGLARPWARDFATADTTLARLKLLESEGCDLALIWPDVEGEAKKDPLKLAPTTRKAIVDFTGGKLPPSNE